jgi:LuxR family maltose regulon positive regulatory protein
VPIPIITTKLRIPQPQWHLVHRPRLTEQLDTALDRGPGLTLVSAPPGFGKTTLVAEWVATCERPVAWLSLDAADHDPARFVTCLVAAIQSIDSSIGRQVLQMLESPPQPALENLLARLVNDLAALPGDIVVVLDDYHLVDSVPIDQALAVVLEHMPPRMRLVIITREDPCLPLARLRGHAQLTELRAADLRFTPDEATEFLERTVGLELSADDVAALEARTEGWIAGLRLAAVSMAGRDDPADFIAAFTGSHRFVMDYLVEEVLHQQPADLQAFLLSTSILDRMCGPLTDALVAGAPATGQATLESLERANLLTIPLDDERRWYRYHHLFAEVLQARLIAERAETVPELHRRASTWFEANGLRPDAIRHALAARDHERAADLIDDEFSERVDTSFRSETWLGWVQALPDELIRSRPRLSLGYAWEMLFLGRLEEAAARLHDAERLLDREIQQLMAPPVGSPTTAPDAGRLLAGQRAALAIAQAFHAQAIGDVAGTRRHAGQVLELAAESSDRDRGLAGSLLALASWTSGDLEAAARSMTGAIRRLRRGGFHLFATSGATVLGQVLVAQGRLTDAVHAYQEAIRFATANGVGDGTIALDLGLAETAVERGDPETATEHLRRAHAISAHATTPDDAYHLCRTRAHVLASRGDLDGALDQLEQAEHLHSRGPIPDVRPTTAMRARVWLRQGRAADAAAWARTSGFGFGDQPTFLHEFEHLTLARLDLARRVEGSDLQGFLQRLLEAARAGGRGGSVIEILALQALAHQRDGDHDTALETLGRALELAEPEGHVAVFVAEGKTMEALLRRLIGSGPRRQGSSRTEEASPAVPSAAAATHARRVLSAFESGGQATPAPHPLIEPLSRRELEVLRLIADGLSNQEISDRLFLALSTVKGHTSRVFDKLAVQRRTEAVARARELGLLDLGS